MSDPRLPQNPPKGYVSDLVTRLTKIFRDLTNQLDGLAGGYIHFAKNTGTTAPTTGKWNVGDCIRNSGVSELGASPNKYVIAGWVCVTAGEPGTWREMRCLTGN